MPTAENVPAQPWTRPPLTDRQIDQIFEPYPPEPIAMLTINQVAAAAQAGNQSSDRLLLVQVGTQVYGLDKVADDSLPGAVIFRAEPLTNPLDHTGQRS